MRLIIFTGAPASGKSSIANQVGKELGIDVISKDEYKIRLFEEFGFNNHDEKKKLSILGEQQMIGEMSNHINKNMDIIVDNNFKNFDEVRKSILESKNAVKVHCIYCYADYSILADRYNERIASRNRHQALYTLNKYPVVEGISEFHPQLNCHDVERIQNEIKENTFGNSVFELNTDNIETDFEEYCRKVIAYIEE